MKNPLNTINRQSTIVDVRTDLEFMGGHVAGSLNIPIYELQDRLHEIRELKGPIILCCASGSRSAHAAAILKNYGIDCINGGSWMEINYLVNKN